MTTSSDPLLAALTDARQRKQQADHDIRLLLAYARHLVHPRPYRLADLARAAGMSISGVRIAYTDDDIQQAWELLDRPDGADRLHGQVIADLLGAEPDYGTRAAIT
jgi:hypothetical protein